MAEGAVLLPQRPPLQPLLHDPGLPASDGGTGILHYLGGGR